MAVVSSQDSPPLSQPICGYSGYATVFINGARIFHIDRVWPRKKWSGSENCISLVEHVDCCPFSKLLGSGKRLVEFPRFAFLRCLVSLPFRADGRDILDILASGVSADFRQPSRSAFQRQVRSA